MKNSIISMIWLILTVFLIYPSNSNAVIVHNINLKIFPKNHKIIAIDHINFPKNFNHREINFALSSSLVPTLISKNAKMILIFKATRSFAPSIYRLKLLHGQNVTIKYTGTIYHPISGINGPYEMGMKTTSGIIFNKGIYLDPFGCWYPFFDQGYINFSLEISLPKTWMAITQGKRIEIKETKNRHIEKWICNSPQKGIYLYGAKLIQYKLYKKGLPKIYVFLRENAPYLAKRYLKAAKCYISFYSSLIGKYPYPKFALVENFWETGYAMPSFTLIGPIVLRLPFIIYSSFPHEILHNWWGNSVFVNYKMGNWCEGLTAYLSDYLIQEELGGKNPVRYRRAILQQYSAFVHKDNEFPLKDFMERNNEAQEAIGYGKSLMMFHMLRLIIGDNAFKNGLRIFYKEYKFKSATFFDIERAFSKSSGKNLYWFFKQWVDRKGAPTLILKDVKVSKLNKNFKLSFNIAQIQEEKAFKIYVPVIITLKGEKSAIRKWVWLSDKLQRFNFVLKKEPLRLDIDPFYQVFRRLLPDQAPSCLYSLFAGKKIFIVIPSNAPFYLKMAYKRLANIWAQSDKSISIVSDKNFLVNFKRVNPDAIWIFGIKNKVLLTLKKLRHCNIRDQYIISPKSLLNKRLTVVICKNIKFKGKDIAVALLASYNPKAIVRLAPRLIHYGRYSFLIFKGRYARCILKGSFKIKIPNSLCWIKKNKIPIGKINSVPKLLLKENSLLKCFNNQISYP